MADQSKRAASQTPAAKAQRAEDGKQAMLDYESAMTATRAKTERLRAQRLARDAAAPPAPAKAPPKKKPAKSAKRAAGTLGEWLDDQQKSGRSS